MGSDKFFGFKIERGAEDRIFPKDFLKIVFGQFFPILSITYVLSLLGFALFLSGIRVETAYHLVLHSHDIYLFALWNSLWVSVPGLIWILVRGCIRFPAYADLWYKITAGLMSLVLVVGIILFPEESTKLSPFLIFALPVHIFMYLFLCCFRLNQYVAQPFQILAGGFLIYGFLIQ
jgi:hypothetical protein